MVIVSPYLIITLSINRLNYSIKRQEWLNENKTKQTIQLFDAYNRLTLALKTHLD